MSRVAAIGLDAGEWTVIDRLIEAGHLPNLARIRRQSAVCALQNEALYRTTLVWEAFLTGKENPADPRTGGIEFDARAYRAHKIEAGQAPPFYAAFPDISAIAFDVPHLSLAGQGRDVWICTWGTHSLSHRRASRPPGLLGEIDAAFGGHPAFGQEHRYAWHSREWSDWLATALVAGSARRVDVARWLQDRYAGWQLFLTVMSESHSIGENVGYVLDAGHPLSPLGMADGHRARFHEIYQALDAAVGRFADGLPPDITLVVFSLHGTAANETEVASTVLVGFQKVGTLSA